MKTLFVSNLFPDASCPIWGLDNAIILQYLQRRHEVRVVATRFDAWIARSTNKLRAREQDLTLSPSYLSIPYIPRVGDRVNPQLYRNRLRNHLTKLREEYPFDRLLCAWLFPDGWAIKEVANELQIPFALIAQGSDVHQYLENPFRRERIVETANRSLGVITRSADLGERLKKAGVHPNIPQTVYNGVDHTLFFPGEKAASRKSLSLPEHSVIILYVGNLLPIKQPELIIRAFANFVRQDKLSEARLIMFGDGPLRTRLERLCNELSIDQNVQILGQAPPETIAGYMRAADFLTLASLNEGVPNVILESLASGLPVVAPAVGGIPEILHDSALGIVAPLSREDDLVQAWKQQLNKKVDSNRVAESAQQFTWERAAESYEKILSGSSSTPT